MLSNLGHEVSHHTCPWRIDNSCGKAGYSSPHRQQRPPAANARHLQDIIVSPFLRRGSVFSQRPCNAAWGMTLLETSDLGVFAFRNPGKLPSGGTRHGMCQFPTICPVFFHYLRTIPPLFGGGGRYVGFTFMFTNGSICRFLVFSLSAMW